MEELKRAKNLIEEVAALPECLQDLAAAYIKGMADAQRIAAEKKEEADEAEEG
jgi:hypothetical protein